ncbi:hypothetical protein TVAG_233160 [Trichomonas vaginalis G3]|uniref:EGF-like domain-containing protein n=1 Tax=Trichomonas vaginalis (strain ATCC PRA-98 / G3) TaxID=412133 RepID=A2ERY5_TRIV3|nr:hypothetical protein TVAGG3_0486610 [Trichomonas vaginalis G3]EAY04580.1 hypothetical protein TVAG_233160 [Trichomonas vaginalis G3]KAI5516079.1 hypothetical protein TVAGG3_0486610 [Trichomonas vaginalis G3]|eukprot:XP_001316803.1 hypothetical protein [Trichomonas vaginalis G3]
MFFAFFLIRALSEEAQDDTDMTVESQPENFVPEGDYYDRYMRNPYGYDEYGYDYEQAYDEKGKPICGPNAEKVKGHCKCKDGFDYGNPRSVQGCYNCKGCSNWASCNYPGECKCYYGYEGNGSFCRQEKVSVKGIGDPVNGVINVSLNFDSDGEIESGFCRFGGFTSKALFACRDYFTCQLPTEIPPVVPVQVSLDGEKWSDDSIVYQPRSKEDIKHKPKSNLLMVLVFIVCMALLSLLLLNTKPVHNEERRPFIEQRRRPKEGVRHRTV